MSKVRVAGFSLSLDGYAAGPGQALENPLGIGGAGLHEWLYPTRTFQQMLGQEGGTTGIDDEMARQSLENVGAWIMGRNMFGPVRGEWDSDEWKGWWGENPPFHGPVFVLTHYARNPLVMEGGTTFHFVTEGAEAALALARNAAPGRDIRISGGTETIRQYLREGAIDELHLAISPMLLGAGENLFQGINLVELDYRVSERIVGEGALHVRLARS